MNQQENEAILSEIGEKVTQLSIANGIAIQNLENDNKRLRGLLKMVVEIAGINWEAYKSLYNL